MKVEEVYRYTSLNVVEKTTGEIIAKDFVEVKKRKNIRGGYVMVYICGYDEAVSECINSKKDYEVLIYIRKLFTYMQVEVNMDRAKIVKECSCSRTKVTEMINSMVKAKLIMRVRRGVYRLNPYMYLPYRSDGSELQKEWDILISKS